MVLNSVSQRAFALGECSCVFQYPVECDVFLSFDIWEPVFNWHVVQHKYFGDVVTFKFDFSLFRGFR